MASASWSFEVDKFLSLILKSGLVELEDLNAACKDFLTESSAIGHKQTFDSLCEFLISTNRITQWQCDRLKEGRWKGFFLDQYKLLNIIESDELYSYYLAEEVSTKHRVRLQIAPKYRTPPKDGKPFYAVEEL